MEVSGYVEIENAHIRFITISDEQLQYVCIDITIISSIIIIIPQKWE